MNILFRYAALLAVGCVIPMTALSGNALPGTYEGKIKEVSGYPGQAGEACVVRIGTASDYGGSTTFSISDVDTILFENVHVDKQLDYKKDVVKLVSPGSATGDTEIVVMRMGSDGLPTYLKLIRRNDRTLRMKSIDCDALTRK